MPVFFCQDCLEEFPSRKDLELHKMDGRCKPVEIPEELKLPEVPAGVKELPSGGVVPKLKVICETCGQEFGNPKALGPHRKKHRLEAKKSEQEAIKKAELDALKCSKCGRDFKHKGWRIKHEKNCKEVEKVAADAKEVNGSALGLAPSMTGSGVFLGWVRNEQKRAEGEVKKLEAALAKWSKYLDSLKNIEEHNREGKQ
jgi:hypothetical protein